MDLPLIATLLLLAVQTATTTQDVSRPDKTFVVLAPKIIRPGMDTNIHYNMRYGSSFTTVSTYIQQRGQVKANSTRPIRNAEMFTGRLRVPMNLRPGLATIAVEVQSPGEQPIRRFATVVVESKTLSIFIQTDKAIYKPSHTVNFRIVAVDLRMMPYRGSCDVEIKDAEENKIKQWKSVDLVTGTLTLKLELSDQPVLGEWTISATINERELVEKTFMVDKYVLPKFEVELDAPSFMLVLDPQLKITIKGKYTYGKGVDGTATVTVTNSRVNSWMEGYLSRRNVNREWSIEVRDLTLVDGKVDVTLSKNQLKTISRNGQGFRAGEKFIISANVIETLTGITRQVHSNKVEVYTSAEKLEFLAASPSSFKPGFNYSGFLKLTQVDGSPVLNPKSVSIQLRSGYDSQNISASFDDYGIAHFSLYVSDRHSRVTLKAKYDNKDSVQATKKIERTESNNGNYLQLSLLSTNLQAGSQASFMVRSSKPGQVIEYQIWSRGSMVTSGSVMLVSQSSFSVQIDEHMAPYARILAYYVDFVAGGIDELIVDSLNFNIEGAFERNPVSVSYSKDTAQPGETVDVRVNAVSGSLVGLLAVDQSVLLLAGGNDITQSDVLSELRKYDTIQNGNEENNFFPYTAGGRDTEDLLSNSGVEALTNTYVHFRNPVVYSIASHQGIEFSIDSLPDVVVDDAPTPRPTPITPTPRKIFPESWIWTNLTSEYGQVIATVTVPDTITSWVASAFAVSPYDGLGVSAEAAKMQVFKPFFVSLNLPYSVVRGEELVLQAIVFNYINRDTNVTVTLPASDEYKSIVIDASGSTRNVKQEETITVLAKANKGTTVSFPLVPSTIGKMRVQVTAVTSGAADAVQRDLLVEAEGVEKVYNQAVLISLQNSTTFTETVAIDFPPNVVNDSARVEFSVIGDVMGPSINGLEKLIKMPYGCGEQNMLNFAPTIFVTEYLTQTNQLTDEVKAKGVGFMEKGYQRELTYQRRDGSFSAWGQSDHSGSMWLTAFVLKSFEQARDFIYIDENILQRAVDWIIRRQNQDGSFPEPGRVIHKEMLGGAASSTVTLTAFVLIAISEVKLTSADITPRVLLAQTKAWGYLESQASSLSDPYSLALTSYALFKSGYSNVDITFDPLWDLSKREGGFQYWVQPQPQPASNSKAWRAPHQQGKAVNIELAAYALQLVTERSGIADATAILKWISAQRNSNGGFSSTQDTVVALQALAKYAEKSFGETNMSVDITTSGSSHSYSITSSNALVLQSRVLNSSTSSVNISASGFGVALAQVSVTYNIEEYEQEPAFDTNATITSESDNNISLRVCTSWLLNGTTGMAVEELGIPSGFSADVEALENKKYSGLKRIEEGDRKVILYFDELGSDEKCVEVEADRTGLVAKARPVAIKVYDYYEPENQQTIFYSSTRLNNTNICDVCGATCEGCTAYLKRK